MSRRTQVFLYVVTTSPTPDQLEGAVPWRVGDEEIFFGPCKKRLREKLRERFLAADRSTTQVGDDERIIIAGFNASQGPAHARKIVWAGDLTQVMTFAAAWSSLTHTRYEDMRGHYSSPLHVKPIHEDDNLIGYRHVSDEHAEESKRYPGEYAWWDDLVDRRMRPTRATATREEIRLLPGRKAWPDLPRDACMTLRCLAWADGQGLALDDEFLRLLREAQQGVDGVSASAPFGWSGGQANGLRGSYLEVSGTTAEALGAWFDRQGGLGPRSGPTGTERGPGRRCR